MLGKVRNKINVLMDVSSFDGAHQTRMGPVLIFIGIALAPVLLWGLLFTRIIPWYIFVIFEVLFAGRIALKILGHEKARMAIFYKVLKDQYESMNSMIRIAHVHDDGLIEYSNGTVAYIISAYAMSYTDDGQFSIDLEAFLKELEGFTFNIYCLMDVKESLLQDELQYMDVYKDQELLQERMAFYIAQDEYCEAHTKLYHLYFLVRTPKYNWKTMKSKLEALVCSNVAKVFKVCSICRRDAVAPTCSRDVCSYIDIKAMLQSKYKNDEFYGSKVMYYGDAPKNANAAKKVEDYMFDVPVEEDVHD